MDYDNIYFNAPIELYRGLLIPGGTDIKSVLTNVLYYCAAKYENKEQAEQELQFNTSDKEIIKKGKCLRNQKYCGVTFSISRALFWDYHDKPKADWDILVLLAYLSLKSMLGHKNYCRSNNAVMFQRMAGYAYRAEYDYVKRNSEIKYAQYNIFTMTTRRQAYYGERLRLELMERFYGIAIYSEKGRRGFIYKSCDRILFPREEALKQLKQAMHNTKNVRYKATKDKLKKI